MTSMPRGILASVALLSALILGGCATPLSPAGSPDAAPTTASPGAGDDAEVGAAWLDGGRMIGIVTQGSSTCVPSAGETDYSDGVLKVTLVEPTGDTPCTADLALRATPVAVPEGVDPTQDLEIEVVGDGYRGDTDLDGVPGLASGGATDYLPSAGWADDGVFVILTWGSSSCPPVLESAVATGPSEVTVTFRTPPADQVCTMDMAPRATVATVDGIEDDDQVLLVIAGGEYGNGSIPIIGTP